MAYLLTALLAVGAFILILSGTFEQPSAPPAQPQSNMPNDAIHGGGADLSSINEINALEEALKNNPNDMEKLLHLAHLLNDSGFYQRAIEKYKTYLSSRPNEADVIVDMGVCYFEMRDFNNAIPSMEKAIKLDPKHQIAHFNLGIIYNASGNKDKAKEYWNKAVEINPNSNIAQKARELLNTQ